MENKLKEVNTAEYIMSFTDYVYKQQLMEFHSIEKNQDYEKETTTYYFIDQSALIDHNGEITIKERD